MVKCNTSMASKLIEMDMYNFYNATYLRHQHAHVTCCWKDIRDCNMMTTLVPNFCVVQILCFNARRPGLRSLAKTHYNGTNLILVTKIPEVGIRDDFREPYLFKSVKMLANLTNS